MTARPVRQPDSAEPCAPPVDTSKRSLVTPIIILAVFAGSVLGASPIAQAASFAVPVVAAVWLGLVHGVHWRVGGAVIAAVSVGCVGALVAGVLSPISIGLGVVTYGSVLLLAVRTGAGGREARLAGWAIVLLATVQSLVGVVQFVRSNGLERFDTGAAGDAVVGTLGTNAATLVLQLALALVLLWGFRPVLGLPRTLTAVILGVGAAALSLASVMHAVLIMLAALAVWAPLQWLRGFRTGRDWALLGVLPVVMIALFPIMQHDNVRWAEKLLRDTVCAVAPCGDDEPPSPEPAAASAFTQATPARTNLLANASFEFGTAGWTTLGGELVLRSDTGAPAGDVVADIRADGSTRSPGVYATALTEATPVVTASVWVSVVRGHPVVFSLTGHPSGRELARLELRGRSGWHEARLSARPRKSDDGVNLVVRGSATDGVTFTLDAAMIEPGTRASPYVDGPSAPLTPKGPQLVGRAKPSWPRKVTGLYYAVFLLPHDVPTAPALGVGLGNYSSRAALILSGEYLDTQPGWLPRRSTTFTEEYVTSLWNRDLVADVEQQGNANQPFLTWQSLYAELGLLALILAVGGFAALIARTTYWRTSLGAAIALSATILAVAFLFDNYAEQPKVVAWLFLTWRVALDAHTATERSLAQGPLGKR